MISDTAYAELCAAQSRRHALAAMILDLERRQIAAADPDLRSDLARRAEDARAQLAAANAVVRAMEDMRDA